MSQSEMTELVYIKFVQGIIESAKVFNSYIRAVPAIIIYALPEVKLVR